MILERDTYGKSGVFGTLRLDDNTEVCRTLEHAYQRADGTFYAKVPQGTFVCVKGVHRLSKGVPFETFEVIGVQGHSGILFHSGNKNEDSAGCILLGKSVQNEMLLLSRTAFLDFMLAVRNTDSFPLMVIG